MEDDVDIVNADDVDDLHVEIEFIVKLALQEI